MWLLLGCFGLPREIEPGVPDPACAARASPVDEARLLASVATLARSPRRSDARREEVRAWLSARLGDVGLTAELRPFTISGVSGTNVVAGPADARVLLAAHYDTVAGSPGADDDASGVAVVLEAARVLGPSVPVGYVLFDAEEPHDATVGADGRNFAFGSQAFVDAGVRAEVVFVLDAVGYACEDCQQVPSGVPRSLVEVDGTAPYWVANTPARAPWADLAATAGAAGLEPVVVGMPNAGRAVRQSRFSDHAPFWDAGVDAVLVTDTALLRNPNYHRDSDRTVDGAFLAGVARGVVAAVACAAEQR